MATKEFLLERRSGIGGSDVAALFGKSPFASAHDVYMRITGLESGEITDNPRMDAGVRLEPTIRQWYEDQTGFRVETPEMLRHPDADFKP